MMAFAPVRRALFANSLIMFRSSYQYRFQYYAFYAFLAVRLFLFSEIWKAAYDGRESVSGVTAETQLVFLTIAMLQGLVLNISMAWYLQDRITTGNIALDLIRPVGLLPRLMAQQVGRTAGVLPHLVVTVPIAIALGSLRPPEWQQVPIYLASLAFAYIVSVLTWTIVGMITFWLLNINGIRAALQISQDFLGGAVVPLWFMPDGLRFVLELLPFNAIFFLPASIYAGQVTGSELIRPFVTQAVWIGILALLVVWVWRRGQRKLVIQGG
jgi:ABC-type uncharacterized transport system permease subunit